MPQETRRTAGRGSAKRPHRYRRTADPPLHDGADALRITRPEVGTAKPDGKVTCRNGFVTDPNVAETAACGRARRGIGNGTFNVSGTNGYNSGHDFGRGGPANLPVVPDLLAFAAHTACDRNEAARQRARRILGRMQGPVRAHAHTRRPCGPPLLDRSRRPTPATGVPPSDAARTLPTTPANPDGVLK